MLNLTCPACDISTRHSPGHCFENTSGISCWLLMCFHTPFTFDCPAGGGSGDIGDCLLHPPGTPIRHGPQASMREGFCNDWIYFDGADAAPLVEECRLPLNVSFRVRDNSLVGSHIRRIMDERDGCQLGYELKTALTIADLLCELGRACQGEQHRADEAYRILTGVREQIMARPGDDWTLADMARLSGYSPSRFSTLYRRYFNVSPTADLIRTRVNAARRLLMYSEYSVSRISELCGFSSPQYFSRTYKAFTGMAPSKVVSNTVKRETKL